MTRPDPAAAAAEPADPPAGSADAGADELPEPELLQATVSSAARAQPRARHRAGSPPVSDSPPMRSSSQVSRLLAIVVIVTTVDAASRLDTGSVTRVTRGRAGAGLPD